MKRDIDKWEMHRSPPTSQSHTPNHIYKLHSSYIAYIVDDIWIYKTSNMMELLFALQNQTECLDGDYYLCSSHFR